MAATSAAPRPSCSSPVPARHGAASASACAAARPGDGTDQLIARADAAPYRAKAAGRDTVVVAEAAAG